MLIITRKTHEQIVIFLPDDREIVITVEKGPATLAFEAPEDVEIFREELLDE